MVYELRITGADDDGAKAIAEYARGLGYGVRLRKRNPDFAEVNLADHMRSVDPNVDYRKLRLSTLADAGLVTLEDLVNISFLDFWEKARTWFYELLELMAEHGARFTDADPEQLLVHDIVLDEDLTSPYYNTLLKAKISSTLVLSLLPKSALQSIDGVGWKTLEVIDRLLRKRVLRE